MTTSNSAPASKGRPLRRLAGRTPPPVRASSLPIVAACPESAYPPQVAVAFAAPEAALGTAIHATLAEWIRAGQEGYQLPVEALLPGVEPTEVLALARRAWRQWRELAVDFPDPQVEQSLTLASGEISSAHPDIYAVAGTEGRILDFKTGRLDTDYEAQLRGYALLLLEAYPEVEHVRGAVLWIREGDVEVWDWSRAEILDWWATFQERRRGAEEYRPGSHCAYCRRFHECQGAHVVLRQAALAVGAPASQILASTQTDPPKAALAMGQVYAQIKMLRPRLEAAAELVKAAVTQAGGVLALGDGRELRLEKQEQKRISAAEGWDVLAKHFGEETLRTLVTIAKGKLEDAVRAGAPRGQKGQAVTDLLERLDQAGALDRVVVTQLHMRRVTSQLPAPEDEYGQGNDCARSGQSASNGEGAASA